jgi:hypothetical protein
MWAVGCGLHYASKMMPDLRANIGTLNMMSTGLRCGSRFGGNEDSPKVWYDMKL